MALRLTLDELRELEKKGYQARGVELGARRQDSPVGGVSPKINSRGKGTLIYSPETGRKMNATEARFGERLELQRHAGEIMGYRFDSHNFWLGPDMWFRPDFEVVRSDGLIGFVDVKGAHTWEDSVIKIKTAMVRYPWYFWQVWEYRKREWILRRDYRP